MSEQYDYMKERVKELELDLKSKDEILAWDADKILEMATKIVEKSGRIAEQDAEIKALREQVMLWRDWYAQWDRSLLPAPPQEKEHE